MTQSADLERFRRRVEVTLDCHLWTGYLNHHGYGQFRAQGVIWQAHRWIYTQVVGPIPNGLALDHLCRVRNCVNPTHLEPVTSRQNTMRSPVANAAIRAAATHCTSGHELSGDNLYVDPKGYRRCRACVRRWAREYKERRRGSKVEGATTD